MPKLFDALLGRSEVRRMSVPTSLAAPLAIGAVVLAIVVTVFAAWDSSSPVLWNDEIGYLSNAQIMAGIGEPRDLSGRGYYYIGWSFVLVPLWWLSSEPEVIYRLAVILSVLASLGTIVPLALIGRRLGLDTWISIAAAAIVVMSPARTVQASLAISESFLALLLAITALFALRFAAKQSVVNTSLLLVFAVWTFVAHGRMASVLGAVLIWVVVARWRQWPSTAVMVGSAVGASLGFFLLYRSLAEQLYGADSNRESVGLERILGADPVSALVAGSGQLWYLQVAWLGLATLGLCMLGQHVRRDWRARRPGGATWAVLAVAGVAFVSVTWLSTRVAEGTARIDMFTYGRYLDPVTTVLAFFGLVWFARGLTRRQSVIVAGTGLGIIALFTVVASVLISRPLDLNWVPTSVGGLLGYPWPFLTSAAGPPWVLASLVGIGALLGFLVLRTRRLVGLVLVALVFASMSVLAEVRTMQPFFGHMYQSFTLRETIEALDPESISFDIADLGAETVSQNAYQFWRAPDPLPVFDSRRSNPTTEYVIARKDWWLAEALGAELIAEDTGSFNNALWRLP